jgi:hypothetical protein
MVSIKCGFVEHNGAEADALAQLDEQLVRLRTAKSSPCSHLAQSPVDLRIRILTRSFPLGGFGQLHK